MAIKSFGHEREFWLFLCYWLFFSFISELGATLLWSSWVPFTLAGDILWLLEFTLIAIAFRKIDNVFSISAWAIKKILLFTLVFAPSVAILAAIINQLLILPFFWDIIYSSYIAPNHLDSFKLIFSLVGGRAITFQLFICAWILIYISLVAARREKNSALDYLRLENNFREAQLSSLTNQLNPHFLFNALNNIRFTIKKNQDLASTMLTSVSELLRYSLESTQSDKVTIRQELEIIERYITIVKAQLEERLCFEMNIPEKYWACLVPPMAIQMLVENGIKHGIENIYKGGVLSLGLREADNLIHISVINDVSNQAQVQNEKLGIGLANIKERLKLMYGSAAALHLVQTDKQFSAILSLPFEKIEGSL